MGPTDATGFVAVDSKNRLIILSFRGSTSLGNWIGNVNIDFATWSQCGGCTVHSGFLQSWTDSKDKVTTALKSAISQNPGFAVIATGHSLGGAISTLAVADLRSQGMSIGLVCSLLLLHQDRFLTLFSTLTAHPWLAMMHSRIL